MQRPAREERTRKKTDLTDAEWLADVAAHGMVRPALSHPPPWAIREMTRYRKTQVDARTKEIQRLEKVLQTPGSNASVASGVWSESAKEIIEALIDGERDPKVLAEMAKSRMRPRSPSSKRPSWALRTAPHGGVSPGNRAHRIPGPLDRRLDHGDSSVAPFEATLSIICSIPGVSRTTAEVMVAEMGTDMSRFPTAGHLSVGRGRPGQPQSRQASL